MDYFVNDDITTAILSHLPVKTLFKCRSVRKSWRDIIDSSFFRNLHIQNQLSNNDDDDDDDAVLLMPGPGDNEHLNGKVFKTTMILDFPSYNDFLSKNETDHDCLLFSEVVGGLICFYRQCSSNPIALCNPILKKIKILPESSHRGESSHRSYRRHVGLGYDSVERDLKVVQLSPRPLEEKSTVVEVYSRKQNKWRKLHHHPLHEAITILEAVPSSSSGGAFAHWYARDETATSTEEFSRYLVVSFDTRNEALKTIKIPHFQDSKKKRLATVLAKEDSLMAFVWSGDDEGLGRLIMWEYKLLMLSGAGIGIGIGIGIDKKEDWIKRGSLGPFNGRVWPFNWWKTGVLLYSWDEYIVFHDCCTRQNIIVRSVNHHLCFRIRINLRPTFISP